MNGTNSPPEGGAGSDSPPGTNRSEGDGAEGSGAEGSGGDGGGGNDGGGSRTADDPLPDIGAAVTDWLAGIGIGGEPSDQQNGGSDSPGTGSADGSDADGSDAGDNGAGGRPAAGGDPDTGGRDGTGDRTSDRTTTADGTDIGIGAEVTNWLAKLGAIGIPGFLLIVLILWLWERWTRAEEG